MQIASHRAFPFGQRRGFPAERGLRLQANGCSMDGLSFGTGDTMAPIKFGVGQSVLRKEDDALMRGKGRYTDDHAPSGAMHALVLRSPHAHAKFTINASRARGLPGVGTILTADDVRDLGDLPCLFNLPEDPFTGPPYPILANGEVRHIGDAVAFVVAETLDQARDAVEAIEVEWTPLPAVIGVANAVKNGAPQVWPSHPGNVLFDVPIGDKKATEAEFAKAHAVAEVSIVNPRVITNYMETRAVVCEYDAKRDHLTLTIGSQGSHRLRDILCQMVLKIPVEKMRVICPDVGGGFGTKLFPYREYPLAPEAAYVVERLVDSAARKLGMTPDAIRRKNFIAPRAMPYKTATGKIYDSGDFAAHMKRAMEIANWKEFPKRAKAAKKQGLVRGIGLSTYVEVCGTMGEEAAEVRLDPNGDVSILIGTQSSGQGHQTAYAQLVAEQFGLAPERVHIFQGDTDQVATGLGTGGSSSIPSGGVSVEGAARTLGTNVREIAAEALETSASDLEINEGTVRIAGTARSVSFPPLPKPPAVIPPKPRPTA